MDLSLGDFDMVFICRAFVFVEENAGISVLALTLVEVSASRWVPEVAILALLAFSFQKDNARWLPFFTRRTFSSSNLSPWGLRSWLVLFGGLLVPVASSGRTS